LLRILQIIQTILTADTLIYNGLLQLCWLLCLWWSTVVDSSTRWSAP